MTEIIYYLLTILVFRRVLIRSGNYIDKINAFSEIVFIER